MLAPLRCHGRRCRHPTALLPTPHPCPGTHPSIPTHAHAQVLASPTTRDFTNVMLFIYRQFDSHALAAPKGGAAPTFKLEEEVCVWGVMWGWVLELKKGDSSLSLFGQGGQTGPP